MSVVACYAEKGKAVIMADSLWTDTSGNNRNIAGPLKVFEISIDVICGVAGNSAIYEVYNKVLCEFFLGAPHFFDDILSYIDSNREELCLSIPQDKIGCMIIAGYTDDTRTDIKVAKLCFEQNCLRGRIYDKDYPHMAILTPPDIKMMEDESLLQYVKNANENIDVGIENLINDCIVKSGYCGGTVGRLSLPKWK